MLLRFTGILYDHWPRGCTFAGDMPSQEGTIPKVHRLQSMNGLLDLDDAHLAGNTLDWICMNESGCHVVMSFSLLKSTTATRKVGKID